MTIVIEASTHDGSPIVRLAGGVCPWINAGPGSSRDDAIEELTRYLDRMAVRCFELSRTIHDGQYEIVEEVLPRSSR
jgi:hypothetical protein